MPINFGKNPQIFFYNRGSRGAWTEVEVFVNGVLVYTDNTTTGRYDADGDAIPNGHYRYMAPFSEDSIIVTWMPTQESNTIRVVLTNRAFENIFPERHYHNNEATVNASARHRQVPVIGEVQPNPTIISADGDYVTLTTHISNALDIEYVYFAINGNEPVQARIARVGASFDNIRTWASIPFNVGDNNVTVTAVHRTGRTTTDQIELDVIIPAKVPGQISFSVDTNTVVNPTFRLTDDTGSVISDPVSGIFTLQKSPAMTINPSRFHLLTMSDAGIIVTNLADLDGSVLTLDESYANQLTFITGDATLYAASINNVRVGNVNFSTHHSFLNPERILFSDNVNRVSSSVSFSIEGFNQNSWATVPLDPNGTIDLASHFHVYRFILPENKDFINYQEMGIDIFVEQWGIRSIWGFDVAYNNYTRILTVVVLDDWEVSRINDAIAVFARLPVDNTLFEVDITTHTAPVVLDVTGHSVVRFELDVPGTLTVNRVIVYPRAQGGRQTFRLWGEEILLPPERYGLFVSYTANGHPFTYFVDNLDATADVVVSLPGTQADYPATLTFVWPPMFAQASFSRLISTGIMSPSQSITRLEPVVIPAGYNQLRLNMFSQLENPTGHVSAAVSRAVYAPDGHNTPITISDTFNGEAFRIGTGTVMGGSNLTLGIRNLVDAADNDNVLSHFFAEPDAYHMVGIVTFTNVNDNTEVFIVPIRGTIGDIWSGMDNIRVFAPNVDGDFYFTITLSTDRSILPGVPLFPFTITSGPGGIITQGVAGYYEEGALIYISAQANVGYRFNGWTSIGGGLFSDANAISTTLTMPASAALVTANFVRLPGAGGGGGGGGGGTATPPADPTTPGVITPETDLIPERTITTSLPFIDVAATAWYYNYIRTVWENSIFQGTAHNQFSPQMSMTRAMFVQALANLEEVDLTAYETASPTFNDVPSSAWHFAAVEWAAGQGIVQGVGNDNFAPNAPITREQMAAMLYRYIQIRGIEIPANQTTTFADFDAISYWAVDAVEAIQAAGIITGRPSGNFDPRTTAIRAEVAAIFARFLNVIEEDTTDIEEIEETEEVEEIDE